MSKANLHAAQQGAAVKRFTLQSAGNPLVLIGKKQTVGKEDAEDIELRVMIHFDAAKRGQCTSPGAYFLTTHLIIASYLASRLKSKRFHDQVTIAYAALQKASDRPTKLMELTTTEHKTIAAALKTYFIAMPNIEVGMMSEASRVAAHAFD